jgi:hypothetical protein
MVSATATYNCLSWDAALHGAPGADSYAKDSLKVLVSA